MLASLPVRKALAHLTNVDAFINNFENGKAVRTIGPVNPDKNTTIKILSLIHLM